MTMLNKKHSLEPKAKKFGSLTLNQRRQSLNDPDEQLQKKIDERNERARNFTKSSR